VREEGYHEHEHEQVDSSLGDMRFIYALVNIDLRLLALMHSEVVVFCQELTLNIFK